MYVVRCLGDDMRLNCAVFAFVCAALLGGCASGYVGARGGAVIVLSGGEETGPVTSSTNNLGSAFGITFGGRFNERVALQTDLSVRTASITQEAHAPFFQRDSYIFDGTLFGSATVVEVPVQIILSKSQDLAFRPFIGIGAHLGLRTSSSGTIDGYVTKLEGEGAGQSVRLSETILPSEISEDPFFGFSAIFGLDYKISKSWSIRGDLRFQHDFVNDYLIGYQIGTVYRYSADITAELPTTRLSVALSLLFAL